MTQKQGNFIVTFRPNEKHLVVMNISTGAAVDFPAERKDLRDLTEALDFLLQQVAE